MAAAIEVVRASRAKPAVKLAFEFLVLTATRSGEVSGTVWTEMNRDQGVWTIPVPRTKGNREHRVPLSRRALEILEEARAIGRNSPLMFPSRGGKPTVPTTLSELLRDLKIAAVPHGFRSSFRDWAAEETDHPREVAEAALAHRVSIQIEAAYRRSDLFERRGWLMDDWAGCLAGPSRGPQAGAALDSRARRGQRGRRRNAKCPGASLPNVLHWGRRGAPPLRTPDRGEFSPGPSITPSLPSPSPMIEGAMAREATATRVRGACRSRARRGIATTGSRCAVAPWRPWRRRGQSAAAVRWCFPALGQADREHGSQIEAANRRSDLFDRRRRLIDDWAEYLAGGSHLDGVPGLGMGRQAGPSRSDEGLVRILHSVAGDGGGNGNQGQPEIG